MGGEALRSREICSFSPSALLFFDFPCRFLSSRCLPPFFEEGVRALPANFRGGDALTLRFDASFFAAFFGFATELDAPIAFVFLPIQTFRKKQKQERTKRYKHHFFETGSVHVVNETPKEKTIAEEKKMNESDPTVKKKKTESSV